ncbi:MAG: methionine--tRNA ligase [Alphaproteobacteria bacterium]|nr:methionine--tRNA ligase [Alphaproteobacteria bacterium]
MKKFYVTTPIYYVNDVPHLGHAYCSVACDVLARFKRLDGYDVMFLSGTDEHGQKIAKAAAKAGIEPQALTDKVSQNFRDVLKALNVSNDDFIRTTEERHIKACRVLWDELLKRNELYLGKYAGWYAVRDEAYYGEDELKDGPNGKKIAPSGAECEWVEEPSYFFRLSAWGDKLLKFYEENPDFILPHSRRNEVISFVKSGMHDLSVSRTAISWGVPVPNEDKHVMYVWLDALTNYLTAVGYPDTQAESYKKYWPADMHVVGKDILRFHAIYWPAFLLAAGLEPPKHIFAHGWWTCEGEKMSKSLGNVIDPYGLIEKYGLDQTRYFVLREVPFGNDSDFSHAAMVRRINSDLANGIGNLAQRTLSQIAKNCGGAVPKHGEFTDADKGLLELAQGTLVLLQQEFEVLAFHKALDLIWALIAHADRYIDEQAPWALKKTDAARMETVLYVLAETLRHIGCFLLPFVPEKAGMLLDQLAVAADRRDFAHLTDACALETGTPLPAPQGLFPRYVDEEA